MQASNAMACLHIYTASSELPLLDTVIVQKSNVLVHLIYFILCVTSYNLFNLILNMQRVNMM